MFQMGLVSLSRPSPEYTYLSTLGHVVQHWPERFPAVTIVRFWDAHRTQDWMRSICPRSAPQALSRKTLSFCWACRGSKMWGGSSQRHVAHCVEMGESRVRQGWGMGRLNFNDTLFAPGFQPCLTQIQPRFLFYTNQKTLFLLKLV